VARGHAHTAVLHDYTVISLPLIYTLRSISKQLVPAGVGVSGAVRRTLSLAETTELLLVGERQCSAVT